MKNCISSGIYYLNKDTLFKNMTIVILIISAALALFIGNLDNFVFETLLYPLETIKNLSVILFFIFPVYFCFFSTEGFESGTIKILISTALTKRQYVFVKFLLSIGIILFWFISFLFVYLLTYTLGAIFSKNLIYTTTFFNINSNDLLSWLAILILLIASSFLICLFGFISRKLSSTAILTFFLLFGDFMFNGYFKDSNNIFIQSLATNTLSANIMKISGNYIINDTIFKLPNLQIPFIVAFTIILITLIITYINFIKSDIK